MGRFTSAFWLLATIDDVARLINSVGFLRKFRDSQSALLGQQCNNCRGSYMAIWPLKSSVAAGGGVLF